VGLIGEVDPSGGCIVLFLEISLASSSSNPPGACDHSAHSDSRLRANEGKDNDEAAENATHNIGSGCAGDGNARGPGDLIRGQAVFVALQANVAKQTGISLLIDDGSGAWRSSSDSDDSQGWYVYQFQHTMLESGTARFALQVFSQNPDAAHEPNLVELTRPVVGIVGQDWTRLI
jgi:hypothetical protein